MGTKDTILSEYLTNFLQSEDYKYVEEILHLLKVEQSWILNVDKENFKDPTRKYSLLKSYVRMFVYYEIHKLFTCENFAIYDMFNDTTVNFFKKRHPLSSHLLKAVEMDDELSVEQILQTIQDLSVVKFVYDLILHEDKFNVRFRQKFRDKIGSLVLARSKSARLPFK